MPSTINASTSAGGGIIQTADASGVLALQAAGTTIASVSSTGVEVTGTLSATGTLTDSTGTLRPLVRATAQATTSGSTITFSSIPSWVRRITVVYASVSTTVASNMALQLGTTSGLETTGYSGTITSIVGATAAANSFGDYNGVPITRNTAGTTYTGSCIFTNISGNIWVNTLNATEGTNTTILANGQKTTAAVLDRIAISCASGSFDAGSINIMYE